MVLVQSVCFGFLAQSNFSMQSVFRVLHACMSKYRLEPLYHRSVFSSTGCTQSRKTMHSKSRSSKRYFPRTLCSRRPTVEKNDYSFKIARCACKTRHILHHVRQKLTTSSVNFGLSDSFSDEKLISIANRDCWFLKSKIDCSALNLYSSSAQSFES
jgi:hypothetical protein